jgi:hypothetical protein
MKYLLISKKTDYLLKALLYFISCLLLPAFWVSNAQAVQLTVNLAVNFSPPAYWPQTETLSLNFFESPTNNWPGGSIPSTNTAVTMSIAPGANAYEIPISVTTASDLYMIMTVGPSGSLPNGPPNITVGGPTNFNQADAWGFGPPWIGLLGLDTLVSGTINEIAGDPSVNQVGSWEVMGTSVPVPETASLLLLAVGIMALALSTRRGCRQPQWPVRW